VEVSVVDVRETELPGLGIRYDFTTSDGLPVGVLVHRSGRREMYLYSRTDPDACAATLRLEPQEAQVLGEIFGASRIVEHLTGLQQDIEGLAIDWLRVEEGSAWAGETLASAAVHTSTGVSVVAIIRDGRPKPSPGAGDLLLTGDVVVAVGTAEGVAAAARKLQAP
jgi:TrkA domain protein